MGVPLMEIIDPAYLKAQLARLDVDLSTRASESTLAGIKSQTDKLTFDASSYLYVNAPVVGNPPNFDVALSTRASESTLSDFSGKFPSASALGDAMSNPTTTIIGSALLGFDGTNWERIKTDGANRLKVQLDSIPNPPNLDVALSTRLSESTFTARVPTLNVISFDLAGASRNLLAVAPSGSPADLTRQPTYDEVSVTTTESSISYAAPGLKLAVLINRGDDDILVRINDSAGTQIKIPARCGKIIGFGGITAIYYVASTSSSTLVINGWS